MVLAYFGAQDVQGEGWAAQMFAQTVGDRARVGTRGARDTDRRTGKLARAVGREVTPPDAHDFFLAKIALYFCDGIFDIGKQHGLFDLVDIVDTDIVDSHGTARKYQCPERARARPLKQ